MNHDSWRILGSHESIGRARCLVEMRATSSGILCGLPLDVVDGTQLRGIPLIVNALLKILISPDRESAPRKPKETSTTFRVRLITHR